MSAPQQEAEQFSRTPPHASHAGTQLVTFGRESNTPDSHNVSDDKEWQDCARFREDTTKPVG
jgi:hypothetical protein